MSKKISVPEIERLWRRGVALDYIAGRAGRTRSELCARAARLGWPARTRAGRFLTAAEIECFTSSWAARATPAGIEAVLGLKVEDRRALAHYLGIYVAAPRLRNYRAAKSIGKPEPDRAEEARARRCLRCRDPFLSEGAGNRLCRECRNYAAVVGAAAPGLLGFARAPIGAHHD